MRVCVDRQRADKTEKNRKDSMEGGEREAESLRHHAERTDASRR